jgi:hypothetical protein
LVGVLIVGFAAGIGVAYLLNLLKPVFYNLRTLAASTGVTVLGAISLTHSDVERAATRAALLRYGAIVCVLFAVFLAVTYLGWRHAPLLANG